MATYRDRAVVLRTHKLGEADRILTLLTRTGGKVRAVARGVRKTSSKFGGRLEPCNVVDIQLVEGRNLDVVAQVETTHSYGALLAADYARYTTAQVMAETADKIIAEDKQPALAQYRLLVGALHVLVAPTTDGRRPASMILDSFLLRSLATAGYAPALAECATCGRPGPHEFFSPQAGGMVCVGCRPPGSARPHAGTLTYLGALLAGDWPATRSVGVAQQEEASGLVASFASWHLDRTLRSLPLVERDYSLAAGATLASTQAEHRPTNSTEWSMSANP